MGQFDWKSAWKIAVTLSLTAIVEVVVIVISEMSNPIFLITSLVASFLASLAIVQLSWVGITRLSQWAKTPKIRNIMLEKKYLRDGTLGIVLSNQENRKSEMWISNIQIIERKSDFFPVSGAGLQVKSKDVENIFFIKYDKAMRYFKIADYQGYDYKKVFYAGNYNFEVLIKYGFSIEEISLSKMFSVLIDLKENGGIVVKRIKSIPTPAT